MLFRSGAKVVLSDTAKDSYEMDYEKLESLINERTKAIIPVDFAGVICDYKSIYNAINNKKNLFRPKSPMQEHLGRVLILGDAAHSFGAVRDDILSGAHADFTVFSFHAVKNLTTAEGGAVTWKDSLNKQSDIIYKQLMLFSLHGQTKDALSKLKPGTWEYDIVAPYYKCNMTDIMAALGLAQLRRYPALLRRRTEIVHLYDELLNNDNYSVLRHSGENYDSCKHLYIVRLRNKEESFRNRIIEKMGEYGIATNVHYKPLPMLTAYKNLGFCINDYPNAFEQYKNSISLPLHTLLTDDDVHYVVESLAKAIDSLL